MPGLPRRDGQPSGDDILAQFNELISGLGLDDLRTVAAQLVSGTPRLTDADLEQLQPGPVPERRRPRRADEVTYHIRVDLDDVRPPIWRRLEVSSHLPLDELHMVLQAAFGWTDSHLHMFAVGPSVWDRSAQRYLCPLDVKESDEENPIPEQDVRLDEVLVDVDDRLQYAYDYGDGWEHVLRLEAVVDRPPDVRARCAGGRRAGPPEDCGGVPGYEDVVAAGEYGGAAFDPDEFDLDQVNAALSMVSAHRLGGPAGTSVGPLLWWLRGRPVQQQFHQLLQGAQLDGEVQVDPSEAGAMVQRYRWLLDAVGATGLRLTAAGYLPPAVVGAAVEALDFDPWWTRSAKREVDISPVLTLRESAQRLGLLRKSRGQLLVTRAGQRLRQDPTALWWHMAARLAPRDLDTFERQASLITLVGVAAGADIDSDGFEQLRTDVLAALGWHVDIGVIDRAQGRYGARDTVDVLDHLKVFTSQGDSFRRGAPTPGGRALARAALRA